MVPTPRRRYQVPLPGGRSLDLGARTLVMGVLNVTPDSFSDGGRFLDPARAVDAALGMIAAGADIIDIGGESTRPGAGRVPADEERNRVLPVVASLASQTMVPLCVDTTRTSVGEACVEAGASILNDVSGLQREPSLALLAALAGVALVLTHTRGEPADMYGQAAYGDVAADVAGELAASVARALDAGVSRAALIVDPGIGFAKKAVHSWDILAHLDAAALLALDLPLLVGASRKSFLQLAIGECPPDARDPASLAAGVAAIFGGAHIVRVHDVAGMVQAARVADMMLAQPADAT